MGTYDGRLNGRLPQGSGPPAAVDAEAVARQGRSLRELAQQAEAISQAAQKAAAEQARPRAAASDHLEKGATLGATMARDGKHGALGPVPASPQSVGSPAGESTAAGRTPALHGPAGRMREWMSRMLGANKP